MRLRVFYNGISVLNADGIIEPPDRAGASPKVPKFPLIVQSGCIENDMIMEMLKELGRRIQKARKEKGLTQQELADLSHVSLKHVQSCERGEKNPSFEVLRAFGKVLNLSLDSLMNLDLPEDEQSANDMRQLYLSCPPAARKALLNSARALADELKEMTQADECDQDKNSEEK